MATVDSEVRTAGSVVDTVLVRETSLHPINSAGDKNINPEAGNSPVPDSGVGSHRTHRGQVTADFDVRMAEFIRDAERALTELRSGRYATKQQLETLQKSVMRSYETNFDRTKKAYFEENPNLPEMEIEYAVATALQRSRTSEIYGRFMQESTDSILAH